MEIKYQVNLHLHLVFNVLHHKSENLVSGLKNS